MSGSKFNISASIRSGYLFVGREWPYLARYSLLPVGVALITYLTLYYQKLETISLLDDFLCNLPSEILYGWFIFVEARLLLLGERVGHLPGDPAYIEERRRSLSACVLIWILFNMAGTALLAYMFWSMDQANAYRDNPLVKVGLLFLIGGGIWGIRFLVAHILAAVGYPIRRYIFQVNGIGISLRLAGLYILTCIPIMVLERGLTSLILPEEMNGNQVIDLKMPSDIPEHTAIIILVLLTLADFVITTLTTATFCYALKDMLGRPQKERTA